MQGQTNSRAVTETDMNRQRHTETGTVRHCMHACPGTYSHSHTDREKQNRTRTDRTDKDKQSKQIHT